VFYPKKWAQHRELEFASRQVNSIEINGTFYSLQRPSSFRKWYRATPPDFEFAVKGSRYITHLKRLRDVDTPLANFFASGVLLLREKLGPLLWQFPPSFRFDRNRMETFFSQLPRDTKEAAALARKHDDRVKDRCWTRTDALRPIRYAIEIRHPSFSCDEFVRLLREWNIALVVADTAGKWPFIEDVTSDFVYVRLHGDKELYVSGYTDSALNDWGRKLKRWTAGGTPARTRLLSAKAPTQPRDVYVYFDNDVKVHAPFDAMRLAHRVGAGPEPSMASPGWIAEEARPGWPAVRRNR
jgi:uncharacterized protein YecE (DUF72 family)